ncbi:MAG: hypothetical protein Q9218_006816, partial [Villophora microphyllina]
MAPSPTKRITRNTAGKKSGSPKAAATITSPSNHTIPRKKRQLTAALATLKSSPTQSRLDSQLHYDLLLADDDLPKTTHAPPKSPVFDELTEAFNYFSNPPNRRHRKRVEAFFQNVPRRQGTDSEYKRRYWAIQRAVWEWAQSFFSTDVSQQFTLPELSKLATEYPELVEYINMTTSKPSTETWEQTIQNRRAEIAFSIVGKVLEAHVFGQELFGASPSQQKQLQEMDGEMADFD